MSQQNILRLNLHTYFGVSGPQLLAIGEPIWIIHNAGLITITLDMMQKLGSRQNA